MTRVLALAGVARGRRRRAAGAQTLAVQAQQAVGTSTESITGGAAQVRVLGEPRRRAAGGRRRGVGHARSHDGVRRVRHGLSRTAASIEIIDAYVEYLRPRGRGLRAVKAGRYRAPFGIWSAGDHALSRLPAAAAHPLRWLLRAVERLSRARRGGDRRRAASVARGERRPPGRCRRWRCAAPASTRCCAPRSAHGPVIVGASYLDTMPDQPPRFAQGRAHFGGADLRVMHAGVLVRGEWIGGRPFDGIATRGGYLDLLVHRPGLGPVTLLGRAERLAYDARRAARALHASIHRRRPACGSGAGWRWPPASCTRPASSPSAAPPPSTSA